MSATEILHFISRQGDAGNLAEAICENDALAARVRKAHTLGFWQADDFGTIAITAKGEAYLAGVAR